MIVVLYTVAAKSPLWISYIELRTYAVDPLSSNSAAADVIATDEVYEKDYPATTIVYELQGEGQDCKFVIIRQDCRQKPSKEILDTTKVGH